MSRGEDALPPAHDDALVTANALHDFAVDVLRAVGMPREDARRTARAMVWADLRGLDAHGVPGKLAQCVGRIREGGTHPAPDLALAGDLPAAAVMEGGDAWGQVAGVRAMELAIEKASTCGVGMVTVRNTSSTAAVGHYPWLAAEQGLVGIAITNGPALIAPPGGTTRTVGNQGHAFAFPTRRHHRLVFDSATSTMSTGEMDLLRERGEALPEGVLLDAQGRPTRDPARWVDGLLTPIGGHRGFGLSLAFEALTGALSGARAMAPHVGMPTDLAQPQSVSLLCLAIDPRVGMPADEFADRVDALVDAVHGSARAAGVERLYVPGERSGQEAERRRVHGVPVSAERVRRLDQLAATLGLSLLSSTQA